MAAVAPALFELEGGEANLDHGGESLYVKPNGLLEAAYMAAIRPF
jgi:hypothetical protein